MLVTHLVAFFGGCVFTFAFYKREIALGQRLKAAVKKDVASFEQEVAKIKAELKKILHLG